MLQPSAYNIVKLNHSYTVKAKILLPQQGKKHLDQLIPLSGAYPQKTIQNMGGGPGQCTQGKPQSVPTPAPASLPKPHSICRLRRGRSNTRPHLQDQERNCLA